MQQINKSTTWHRMIGKLVLCMLVVLWSTKSVNAQSDSLVFANTSWTIDTLQKGLIHYQHHFTNDALFAAPQNIHMLRLSQTDARQRLGIVKTDTSRVNTSDLSREVNAIAAINGSFFNMKTGASVNFIKIDGQVTDSTQYDVNQKALKANQQGVLAFDAEGISIFERIFDTKDTWINDLKYDNAMESGPVLIMHNVAVPLADTPFNKNRHPRTCVCLTEDDFILLTADGRSAQAYGLNLDELTMVLQWLGCKNALNLDGGGSTTMYLQKDGVVNMPSDNKLWDHEGERAVSNALIIKSQKK